MDTIIIDGLSFALPLFIMAIGGIYSESSGITNLALEGFQGFGGFTGALVAVLTAGLFQSGSQMPFYIAVLFAILGGALFSMIHAELCIRFKANQVISGVVMNILAASVTAFLTKFINRNAFGAPSDKFVLGVAEKISVPGISGIPVIGAFFRNIYPFEIIIIVVALFAWYLLYRSSFGMYLRACGDNPHAVDAAGIRVARIRYIAVVISGALSGIAGISFAYSISGSFSPSLFMGYGYLAIAALIFGNWRILPTLGACLLFGFARSGGYSLSRVLELPSAYSDLIMSLPYLVTLLLLLFVSKHNRAPKALGEVYDKGKR